MTAQAKRRPGQGRRPVKVAGGQTLPADRTTACATCGRTLALRDRLKRRCPVCQAATE